MQASGHRDVCRHSCPAGSHRELGASFPGPHLQSPESEANKGVHPEEGGGPPEDRLHPFPPQPSLPRGLLTLQPLDLLGAEGEAVGAVRRDTQPACCCTLRHMSTGACQQASKASWSWSLCVLLPPCLTCTAKLQPSTWTSLKGSLAVALDRHRDLSHGTNALLNLCLGSTYSRPARVR